MLHYLCIVQVYHIPCLRRAASPKASAAVNAFEGPFVCCYQLSVCNVSAFAGLKAHLMPSNSFLLALISHRIPTPAKTLSSKEIMGHHHHSHHYPYRRTETNEVSVYPPSQRYTAPTVPVFETRRRYSEPDDYPAGSWGRTRTTTVRRWSGPRRRSTSPPRTCTDDRYEPRTRTQTVTIERTTRLPVDRRAPSRTYEVIFR